MQQTEIGNWVTYGQIEKFLEKTEIDISFDEDGLVGVLGKKNAHLDVYSMKGTQVDWESNPECRIDDIKNFLAVFFKNYDEKFEELLNVEV